jgi:hypothetical protein
MWLSQTKWSIETAGGNCVWLSMQAEAPHGRSKKNARHLFLCVTLPKPPTHKNTTKNIFTITIKQMTPAICSHRRCCRCRHCLRRCHVHCQEPPRPSRWRPRHPLYRHGCQRCCRHRPCCPRHTQVVTCRCLPSTPTIVVQVIPHRHRRCSPPTPSSMSRR